MVHFLYYIRRKLLKYYSEDSLDIYLAKIIEKYYKIIISRKRGVKNLSGKRNLIVSLTTIPDRIDSVWITIESLLRLAKDEFDGIKLPRQLQQQVKRGLSI